MPRRKKRRRRIHRRRPKYRLGDRVRIDKVSVAYRLAELNIPIGAGVHLVVKVMGASSEPGCEKGAYATGCLPDRRIPKAVGTRARSRVNCLECIAAHPDKV